MLVVHLLLAPPSTAATLAGIATLAIVPLDIPSVFSNRFEDSPFGAFLGLHHNA
jgi:hypothetical protein